MLCGRYRIGSNFASNNMVFFSLISVLLIQPRKGIQVSFHPTIRTVTLQAEQWITTHHSISTLILCGTTPISGSLTVHRFDPNPPISKPQFSPPKKAILPSATTIHLDQAVQGLPLPPFQPRQYNDIVNKKYAENYEGFLYYMKNWHLDFQNLVFKTIKLNLPNHVSFPPSSILLPWFHNKYKHHFFLPKEHG